MFVFTASIACLYDLKEGPSSAALLVAGGPSQGSNDKLCCVTFNWKCSETDHAVEMKVT